MTLSNTLDISWIPSPYHRLRFHKAEAIVIHFTGGHGDERSLGRFFQTSRRPRSSHYGVGRTGGLAQYVREGRVAFHAGDGMLPTHLGLTRDPTRLWTDTVNQRTIGIEVCNRGFASSRPGRARVALRHRNPRSTSTSWEVFPEAQMVALVDLCSNIRAYNPEIKYVLGHEDVTNYVTAGGSKLDPGPAFPWELLAPAGLQRVCFNFKTGQFEHVPL